MGMKKFFLRTYNSKFIKNNKGLLFLILISILFAILRFPSLFEPYWYGDEGIYQVVANGIREGRVLYQEIWDNKPPLIYIIYAIGGNDLFFPKLLSLIFGLLSSIVIFFLSGHLFQKKYIPYITTTLYVVLFATPLLEGNIANAENFMLLPITLGAYLTVLYVKKRNIQYLALAGISLSFAFITKVVGVFDFAAFMIFLLLIRRNNMFVTAKELGVFTASFLSLFLVSVVYFFAVGAFNDFLGGVLLRNVSYVGEQYGSANPEVILLLKTILLSVVLVGLFTLRKRISTHSLFVYLWVAFGLYSAFFSDRPYTHYLILLLPGLVLLFGNFLEYRHKTRIVDIVLLCGIVFVAYSHFQVYKKTVSYYSNYINFLFANKSVTEYYAFFDRNTPRDYAAAQFIRENTTDSDSVFLMSDSAQVYALSDKLPIGKWVVYYHITSYEDAIKETKILIDRERPKFIIKTVNDERVIQQLLSSYQLKYIIEGAEIYETEI